MSRRAPFTHHRTHGKQKRAKLLRQRGWRCENCGCRIAQVKTVRKHRTGVVESKAWIEWQPPHGARSRLAVATVEHHIQLSRGGSNHASNLSVWCYACNARKKLEDERGWAWETEVMTTEKGG